MCEGHLASKERNICYILARRTLFPFFSGTQLRFLSRKVGNIARLTSHVWRFRICKEVPIECA